MSINATVVNDTRYMMQFRFWLNAKNDLESWLADECAKLKSVRQFQTVVRNALRLYLSLQAGQLDVLMELFPFAVNVAAPVPGNVGQPSLLVPRSTTPPVEMPELEVNYQAKQTSKWRVAHCNIQIGLYHLGSIKELKDLDDEVLAYGIHFNKLNKDQAQAILARRGAKNQLEAVTLRADAPNTGNAKPIPGANVKLVAPDFNDLPEL